MNQLQLLDIESNPPITTAGSALSAETKLACVSVLNPPVIKNPAKPAIFQQ